MLTKNDKAVATLMKNGIIADTPATRHKLTVTIPSTVNIDQPIPENVHSWLVDYTARKVAGLCGGVTVTYGQGGYIANDGSLVRENVAQVSTLCTVNEQTIEAVRAIRDIAYLIKDLLSQESVLFEVQEVSGYFI